MKYKDNLNKCRNEHLNCKVPWVSVSWSLKAICYRLLWVEPGWSFCKFAVCDTACFWKP